MFLDETVDEVVEDAVEMTTEWQESSEFVTESTEDEMQELINFDEDGFVLIETVEEVLDPTLVLETGEEASDGTVVITEASQLPAEIPLGTVYELGEDITLSAGQQITELAGTLDGKGHVITLVDKPLANNVTGTIQNLGITSSRTITVSGVSGTMAVSLSGVIQNCYSTAMITTSGWDDVGGLVGSLNTGTIQNSYFAGTNSAMFADGLVGANSGASILANCYFTVGYSAIGTGVNTASVTNCSKTTADNLKTASALGVLNTNIPDSGYHWALPVDGRNSGLPVLEEGKLDVGTVDKSSLEKQILEAENLLQADYTGDSWSALQTALKNAQNIINDTTKTQTEVNAAETELVNAISGLMPGVPVKLPEEVVTIASQADFAKLDNAQGKYFILTADITIDSNYQNASMWMNKTPFYGVLDGQGHSVTFDNVSTPLVDRVEVGAVVQNVTFKGNLSGSSSSPIAPLGKNMKGAVLNCSSEVSGTNVSGFAVTLYGGVISNCFAFGDLSGGGALVGSYNSGTVQNSYWVDTLKSTVSNATSYGMAEDSMKTLTFVEKMNCNRGTNGTAWGQSASGYPYFGENQEYIPDTDPYPELPEENKYQVTFTPHNGTEGVLLEDSRMEVSADNVDDWKVAGTFALVDYTLPEGSSLNWSLYSAKPADSFGIAQDTGELFVYGNGKAVVSAVQQNADGSTETLAYVSVVSTTKKIEAIKLMIDGKKIGNEAVVVQGSETKRIHVMAKYEGTDVYTEVAYSGFSFQVSDSELVYSRSTDSCSFYFKKPGTAAITVTSKQDSTIATSFEATSVYVPVESVVPALNDTYEIHGRNGLSDGYEADGRIAFDSIHGNAIVTPANATYANQVIISSSDETVGYFESGEKVYVPKQAGTVTFTATVSQTDPETGETSEVTGSKDVTFTYKNPVTSVVVNGDPEITVESGQKAELKIEVTGSLSANGYSVTEPGMNWTYDKKGIAQIVQKIEGGFKREEDAPGAPDLNLYLPKAKYEIVGLSEGTVIATGTPIDTTNNVAPVTITIHVTAGTMPDLDIDSIVTELGDGAISFIENTHRENGYAYGNEWLVFSLLRAGKTIEPSVLDAYYHSVAAEVKTWSQKQKPTDIERAALVLTMMGKDITNVDGVNLAEMIYNSPYLNIGANELAYALLALDAADVVVPVTAKWNRSAIIAELLKFQNAETGGFGLNDNQTSSVDITAMSLQALANYKNRLEVKTAIDKALVYLQSKMQDDFGYGNSEATSQVLLALSLLGIDPMSSESGFGTVNWNMVTNLQGYQKADGGYSHLVNSDKSQEMSTVQVLQALNAYQKSKDGELYWNVNGVKVEITFSLLGDSVHDSETDQKIHTRTKGGLEVWIPADQYRIKSGITVAEFLNEILDANGMSCKNPSGNYVESITRNGVELAEFSNGFKSGWKYTLNGVYSELGVGEQTLNAGDVVVFHYTDDYTKETDKIYDAEQAKIITNTIQAIPSLDKLTIADVNKVQDARDAYESLTAAQKAEVPADVLNKLIAAEAKIAELKKAEGEEPQPQPHVHSWDAGTVTKAATCKETGLKTFKCSCGENRTETIVKSSTHKYSAWKVSSKATVKAAEVQKHACQICGKEETQSVGSKLTPVLEVPGKLKSFNIKKGKTAKFTVTMANGDSVSSVKSSKTKYLSASLDQKTGKITLKGKKTGTSKLTIKLASGKSRTYTVKVVKETVKTSSLSVTNVTGKKLTLQAKKSYTLKYELKPFTTTQKVTYKSSNKKVATVTSSGKVKAVAPGKATITVTSGSKKVKITVTVPGITISQTSVSVKKGKTLPLKPTTYGISGAVTYTSSNTKVATVTSKGKIKGIKKGTAKITIKAGSFKKTVTVKVK